MREKLRRLRARKPRLYQMALYLLYGVLTTLVNWACYLVLTGLLGLSTHERDSAAYRLIANFSQAVSWLLSVLFAYFTNRRYVFQSDTRKRAFLREAWQFVSARVLGYALFDLLLFNIFLLFMSDRWSKLIMNVLVIIYNYLASRFVIFKKPKPKPGSPEEKAAPDSP